MLQLVPAPLRNRLKSDEDDDDTPRMSSQEIDRAFEVAWRGLAGLTPSQLGRAYVQLAKSWEYFGAVRGLLLCRAAPARRGGSGVQRCVFVCCGGAVRLCSRIFAAGVPSCFLVALRVGRHQRKGGWN